MANEITIAASISCTTSDGATIASGTQSKSVTQVADPANVIASTMEVAAGADNAELLPLGEMGGGVLPGFLMIKNLDPTNFVELALWEDGAGCVGATEFDPHKIAKVGPGQYCLLTPVQQEGTPDRNYLYVRADTAAVQIQYWACEA